MADYITNFR